ncbi:hypothetical protein H6F89_30700 [Cyanobacteria bacterium FACHB-63]|nr:hypothetical protein [Cyanobacteria bacterium FACHB-63]
MIQLKADRVLTKVVAFLCLSISIASETLQPSTAIALTLGQSTPNASTSSCQAERQQAEAALLNAVFEQTEQTIASGQLDAASQLLVRALQQIQAMPNSSTKINLLERLVGSLGENVAYTSPLERLMRAVPAQTPQAALAVLSTANETNKSLSSSYSASKVRTFVALANYFTQLGQIDRSSSILGYAATTSYTIQGVELQTIAVSNIAEAYLNAKQIYSVPPFLDRALQLAQTVNHSNPYCKANALDRIASLYARLGQLDRALEVARLIQVPNYHPLVILTIVNRYSETGQVDRALELLQTLSQADQKATALATLAGRSTGLQPQRARQLYAQAVTTARSTQNVNEVIANVALRYIEAGGLVTTADETIQTITDPVVKALALAAIALSYAKSEQNNQAEIRLTQAIKVLEAISEPGSRNTARQQLIDQATQSGRYDYALRITQTIQPQEKVPIDCVEVQAQIAERAIAANRYDAALQITQQIPPSFASWRDRLLPPILKELVRTKAFDQALEIAQQKNPDPSFQPRMLAIIAAQAKRSGQNERSTALFNQAIQLANQIDDASTKSGTLGAIAQAYLTIGQLEQATRLLNQTISVAQAISDISTRSYTLRSIAEQLTFANHYQAAIQVAEAIPDPSERLAKLNEAMEKAINARNFVVILTTLSRLDDPVFKARWFLAVADRYIQLSESNQAANVLNQALQVTRTIPGNESKTIAVRGGENPLVVDDHEDRGSFLMAIALKYAQIGQVSQAQQIVQTLQDAAIRQQLIQQINCYR